MNPYFYEGIAMKFLLVCDLDETLIGDKEGIMEFNAIVFSNKERFYLVYSSGRFKTSMISVIEKEKLIQPNAIVSNIGTEIYYAPNWNIDEKWKRIISKNWAKERAASILDKFNLKLQPYKKRFAIPYYTENEAMVGKIKEALQGYRVKVVYTKKQYLDIIPENAGKGSAAKYIGNRMNLPIICCGDSENDIDMLKKSKYGILVGNAPISLKRELSKCPNIYISNSYYAKGIIEGLESYNIIG